MPQPHNTQLASLTRCTQILYTAVSERSTRAALLTVDAKRLDLALVSDDQVGGIALQSLHEGVVTCNYVQERL